MLTCVCKYWYSHRVAVGTMTSSSLSVGGRCPTPSWSLGGSKLLTAQVLSIVLLFTSSAPTGDAIPLLWKQRCLTQHESHLNRFQLPCGGVSLRRLRRPQRPWRP